MKIKIRYHYLFYCILVMLPIYQDSPFTKYLGNAGTSFLPVVSLLGLVCYAFIRKSLVIDRTVFTLINMGLWLIFISFSGILIWVLLGNQMTLYGEWMPVKAFKVILQYFAYPAYVILLLIHMRKLDIDGIFYPIFATLILLTLICIIEKQQLPFAFQSLHFSGTFPYYRIRLLTKESSWTTVLIYNYVTLSLFYALQKKRICTGVISCICAAILLGTSGAKSLLIATAISILIYMLLGLKKLNKKSLWGICIAVILGIFFIIRLLPRIQLFLLNDIALFTSVATRLYTIFIGGIIGLIFPAGVGGGIYLGIFPGIMDKLLYLMDRLPIKLNTSEILLYINGTTDTGLSVKAGLFHYHMYWGILGTFILFKLFLSLSYRLKYQKIPYQKFLLTIFWCNIILLATSVSFTFEFWLLVAVMTYYGETKQTTISSSQLMQENTLSGDIE